MKAAFCVVVVALGIVFGLGTSGQIYGTPAWTSPTSLEVLARAPDHVELAFNGLARASFLEVYDHQGVRVDLDNMQVSYEGSGIAVVRTDLEALAEDTYTISYRIVKESGVAVEDEYVFVVDKATYGSDDSPSDTSGSSAYEQYGNSHEDLPQLVPEDATVKDNSYSEAINWAAGHLPGDSVVLTDSRAWASNLQWLSPVGDGPVGDRIYYYKTIASDSGMSLEVLGGSWRGVDYLIFADENRRSLLRDDAAEAGVAKEALMNADELKAFGSGNDIVSILRVRKLHEYQAQSQPLLRKTWASYENNFIEGGRVIDPIADRHTTSEGQSYALLRSLYMDDRHTFKEVWEWTEANLQVRKDALFAWQWGQQPSGAWGVIDRSSATDADQDVALALLLAARHWNVPEYRVEALKVLDDIWKRETLTVAGKRIVVAGDWSQGGGTMVKINPSYFAPYAYRIFAEADPEHPWMELVDSSYRVLSRISETPELGGKVGLVPDWVTIDLETGNLQRLDAAGSQTSEFSYDASRVPLRLALDWMWFGDPRAKKALESLRFPRREIQTHGRLLAAYSAEGAPAAEQEALSMYAGALPALLFDEGNRGLAHRIFTEKILGSYEEGHQSAYWGDNPRDYYNQNMAWFTVSVINGSMGNLWEGQTTVDWDDVLFRSSNEE